MWAICPRVPCSCKPCREVFTSQFVLLHVYTQDACCLYSAKHSGATLTVKYACVYLISRGATPNFWAGPCPGHARSLGPCLDAGYVRGQYRHMLSSRKLGTV